MRPRLLLALLVLVTAPAAAQDRRDDGRVYQRDYSRQYRGAYSGESAGALDTTVAFHAGGLVAISSNEGNIVVRTGNANQVVVHARTDGGRIHFDAGSDRISIDLSDARGDQRLDVTVPVGVRVQAQSRTGDVSIQGTGSDVSVHNTTGDVKVDGASGHVDLSTLSGDLTASRLKGTVSSNTVSGDLTITGLTGSLTANSVSGDVTLHDITSQSIDAQTTSGDVTFDGGIDPAGRYSFNTHSGDISMELPARASAQLTVSTWSGSIDSDFPITLQPGEHDVGVSTSKRFTFTIGGGEARIRAESFNGDIVIHRRGGR